MYEILKDFQPLIATMVALITAVIAYLGATAKGRWEKKQATKATELERLGICLRLSFESGRIASVAKHLSDDESLEKFRRVVNKPPAETQSERFMFRSLVGNLQSLTENDTAWEKIHLFPSHWPRLSAIFT